MATTLHDAEAEGLQQYDPITGDVIAGGTKSPAEPEAPRDPNKPRSFWDLLAEMRNRTPKWVKVALVGFVLIGCIYALLMIIVFGNAADKVTKAITADQSSAPAPASQPAVTVNTQPALDLPVQTINDDVLSVASEFEREIQQAYCTGDTRWLDAAFTEEYGIRDQEYWDARKGIEGGQRDCSARHVLRPDVTGRVNAGYFGAAYYLNQEDRDHLRAHSFRFRDGHWAAAE